MAKCTTYPAVPGTTAVPARIDVTPIHEWNAGAIGGETTDGDVELKLSEVPQNAGAVVGFTADDLVSAPGQMSHAFYFHTSVSGSRMASAMEAGATVVDFGGYTDATEFVLQRAAGVVLYLIDGALRYTARGVSAGPIHVGCALYATGDALPSNTTDGPDPEPPVGPQEIGFTGDANSTESILDPFSTCGAFNSSLNGGPTPDVISATGICIIPAEDLDTFGNIIGGCSSMHDIPAMETISVDFVRDSSTGQWKDAGVLKASYSGLNYYLRVQLNGSDFFGTMLVTI